MRVAFVSTYPPQRCGIGTYTAALAGGFIGAGEPPVVLSEFGALSEAAEGVVSMPSFSRKSDYSRSVADAAVKSGVDAVHVQHAPDLFGMDDRLPRLLDELRARRIKSIVTLHTVHSPRSGALERRFGVARFHRRLASCADAIVVHGEVAMADELVRQGVPRSKVHVIAHGTSVVLSVERSDARLRLDLPVDAPLLLYFGFIHPQKNVHTLILAMAKLKRASRPYRLCIAGSLQNPSAVNRGYVSLLRWLVRRSCLEDTVIFREGFVSARDSELLYHAADLVLLPYAQGYGSASGVAHHAIGASRLPLCSRSPKFAEVGHAIDRGLLVSTHSPTAWARAIEATLGDENRRAELTGRLQLYAEDTAWPRVAAQHQELYRSLL